MKASIIFIVALLGYLSIQLQAAPVSAENDTPSAESIENDGQRQQRQADESLEDSIESAENGTEPNGSRKRRQVDAQQNDTSVESAESAENDTTKESDEQTDNAAAKGLSPVESRMRQKRADTTADAESTEDNNSAESENDGGKEADVGASAEDSQDTDGGAGTD